MEQVATFAQPVAMRIMSEVLLLSQMDVEDGLYALLVMDGVMIATAVVRHVEGICM